SPSSRSLRPWPSACTQGVTGWSTTTARRPDDGISRNPRTDRHHRAAVLARLQRSPPAGPADPVAAGHRPRARVLAPGHPRLPACGFPAPAVQHGHAVLLRPRDRTADAAGHRELADVPA